MWEKLLQYGLPTIASWLFGGRETSENKEQLDGFIQQMLTLAGQEQEGEQYRKGLLRPLQGIAAARTGQGLRDNYYISPTSYLNALTSDPRRTLPGTENNETFPGVNVLPYTLEGQYNTYFANNTETYEDDGSEITSNTGGGDANPWIAKYREIEADNSRQYLGWQVDYWNWVKGAYDTGAVDTDSQFYDDSMFGEDKWKAWKAINWNQNSVYEWRPQMWQHDSEEKNIVDDPTKRPFDTRGTGENGFGLRIGSETKNISETAPGGQFNYAPMRSGQDMLSMQNKLYNLANDPEISRLTNLRTDAMTLPELTEGRNRAVANINASQRLREIRRDPQYNLRVKRYSNTAA